MFDLVPYKHKHVIQILDQKINLGDKDFYLHGPGKDFEKRGTAFTGMYDGIPMVCGAIENIWPGRGIIWCMFNENAKQNFVPVFRGIRKFLNKSKLQRIEVCIPCGFETGVRRAKMLGFEMECERARKYLSNGTDCTILVRIRE